MIKQYIKTKISNFVNRIATEVAQTTAREVAENVAREIGNEVAQTTAREVSENIAREIGTQVAQTLIEQNNLANSHKFNKLMGISFELSKRYKLFTNQLQILKFIYKKMISYLNRTKKLFLINIALFEISTNPSPCGYSPYKGRSQSARFRKT